MSYTINISKAAKKDIADAQDYITYILKNPLAADDLLLELKEKFMPLEENPKMHPVIDDPVLKSYGIRFTMVKRYIAFYTIEESSRTVHIVRFMFGKSNWSMILKRCVLLQ